MGTDKFPIPCIYADMCVILLCRLGARAFQMFISTNRIAFSCVLYDEYKHMHRIKGTVISFA